MYRLSLRNNRLKFKTAGKLPIISEEFIEYTPISSNIGKTEDVSTCNWLDLQTLGSQPIICPKISPITASVMKTFKRQDGDCSRCLNKQEAFYSSVPRTIEPRCQIFLAFVPQLDI